MRILALLLQPFRLFFGLVVALGLLMYLIWGEEQTRNLTVPVRRRKQRRAETVRMEEKTP